MATTTGPAARPVVDGDLVFCHGVEGMLHCVNVKDGKVVWKVDERTEFGIVQNFFGVGSTPVVEGDLLIVQVGGSPPGSDQLHFGDVKGNKSGVVAFDKRTGKVRYSISDELASYSSPVLATIDGRRWCFVFARGGLLAFDPANGKIDFHFPWRAADLRKRQRQQPDRDRQPGLHFRDVWPRRRPAQGPARRLRRGLERRQESQEEHAMPLDDADPSRRLRLRLQRPARFQRRAALHGAGHRQGHCGACRA